MASRRKEVRILLTGEHGVGKTSLIMALVSEEFPDEVPARAEEITIPADVTPERVPTQIVDTSAIDQTEEQILDEIDRADVICLCYSADEEYSVDKLSDYWLPLVRQRLGEDHRKPIILVGNKCDLYEQSSMDMVLPVMNQFQEVETVVECSAKTLKNITELFYYAQKAVLHPTAPLYLPEAKILTPGCQDALTRIFKICDHDNDGILCDDELNQFQTYCFNSPLQPSALEDVKAVVRKGVPDGVLSDGLALKGFLYLHLLFIQRGRHETTWTVLRRFGYDDDLVLDKDYLFLPELQIAPRCTTELTDEGFAFLEMLFEKYDQDNDGCLSHAELQALFSTCPVSPWPPEVRHAVKTNMHGWITRNGYLAQWAYQTYVNLPLTLETLAYLGYMYTHKDHSSAITQTRSKETDLAKRQTSRTVFQCYVFGEKGVGKTTLVQGVLGRSVQYLMTLSRDTELPAATIAAVPVFEDATHIILREVESDSSWFRSPLDQRCDVACLLYDVTQPHTAAYCVNTYRSLFAGSGIPVLFVAGKSDQTPAPLSGTTIDPGTFCRQQRLPPPVPFTGKNLDHSRDIYEKLAALAAYPHGGERGSSSLSLLLKLGVGLAVFSGLGFLLVRHLRKTR